MTNAQPEKILKELAGLWGSMSKSESQGVNSGVLRACAMTLVVAAKDESDAAQVSSSLGELMHEHPSRAIVLRPEDDAGVLDARVYAQCWMPFGKRQQICCEQIEISASAGRVSEIPGVIVGIMAPDLPVVLWARNAEWLEDDGFQRVFPLVHKIIVDSRQIGDTGLHYVRALRKQGKLVGDLAWTKLTSARQTIANVFADAGVTSRFKDVTSIAVEHTGDLISAAYLAGWLASGAPAANVTLARAPKTAVDPAIRIAGPGLDIAVDLSVMLAVRVNQDEHRAMVPLVDDGEAMREELSVLCPDAQFNRSIEIAGKLLEAVGR